MLQKPEAYTIPCATCRLRTQIAELYLAGYSTSQVASKLNISRSYAANTAYKLGIARDRVNALKQWGKKQRSNVSNEHWRTCRARAVKLWEETNGIIPPGYHIHHKDGDYTNNDISNLECLPPGEHYLRHTNPVPRHLRPERQAYMKAYLKKYVARRKEAASEQEA